MNRKLSNMEVSFENQRTVKLEVKSVISSPLYNQSQTKQNHEIS